MSRPGIVLLAALLQFAIFPALSYELRTHARMANAAFSRSVLNPASSTTIQHLGIDVYVWPSANPFAAAGKDVYFETRRNTDTTLERAARDYDRENMPRETNGKLNADAFRVNGWLMRGAIREDDGALLVGDYKGEPWNDAPFGSFNRFCIHFFDPLNANHALSKYCPYDAVIQDAAQWALGSQNPFQVAPVEDTGRRNNFSVRDARDAMWRALTLTDRLGQPLVQAGHTREEFRKMYWATTFRSLGDVVHLVQDMAQPQHTRNEGHGLGSKGIYEKYIEARASRENTFFIDGVTLQQSMQELPDLSFGNHPIPRFNRYSDYWTTRPTSGLRFGLADYSNRGFFTEESNVGNTTYAEPSGAGLEVARVPFGSFGAFDVSYVYGSVEDKLTQGVDRISMSTQGVFAGLVQGQTIPNAPIYMLSKQNFDDRAALLIPRAVAYSAGIIDYFFRGKLEIALPDEGVYAIVDHSVEKDASISPAQGFHKIKLKLKNVTEDIGGAKQNMVDGQLFAVVKFRRNTCYTQNLSGEWSSPDQASRGSAVFDPPTAGCRSAEEDIAVSDRKTLVNLPAGGAFQAFEFSFSTPIPINATDVYLQAVYRGVLGSEDDAVAVETRDIGEPAFTTYQNSTDFMFCHDSQMVRYTDLPESVRNQYPPVALTNVRITYGSAPLVNVRSSPPAEPGSLPAGSLIRYATLGDLNHNWSIAFELNGSPYTINHNIHPTDPRFESNQIYYSAAQRSGERFAARMNKIPFGFTAYGETFYLADSSCPGAVFPADQGTPPTLLPVVINGPLGTSP